MQKAKAIEFIFSPPDGLELKGDRELWIRFRMYFVANGIPEGYSPFVDRVESLFKKLSGYSLNRKKKFRLVRYPKNRCKNECWVDPVNWKFKFIPLLIKRYQATLYRK